MTLANWRDLSIIWLALLAAIFSLVPGVILYFLTKGMMALIRKLRTIFPIIYFYFRRADQVTNDVSRKMVAPVIMAHEKSTQVRASGAALATMVKGQREVAR